MPPADQPAQAPRTALDDYDLASLALCAFEGVTQPRITRTKWKDGIDLEIATPGLRRFADAVVERELSSAKAEAERLREALEKVERWQFPPTGKFWESGNPVSYIAAYGSNGERDYMREVARAALAATRKEEGNMSQDEQATPTPRTDSTIGADKFVPAWKVRKDMGQLERELSAARAEAERLREALSFYADDRRYLGPNQRREEGDNWTPEDHPYMVDVSRDRGEIAKAALAATRKEEGNA